MKHVHRFGTMVIIILVTSNILASPNSETIYYPQRKDTVSIEDIKQNWDSLVENTLDLKNMIVSDIRKNGVIQSFTNHGAFYGGIFIYGVLFILHRRNRRKP